MSLIDALLLEPAPFEVWLAVRTDGQKGSGTQSDPWNAEYIDYPEVTINSLSALGTAITATTAAAHGFSTGDMVTVFGVERASPSDVFYCGTFSVVVTDSTHFTYTAIAPPVTNPASVSMKIGAIKCVREREQFDALMRYMPTNTTIRLGPGTFKTKGSSSGHAGRWEIKAGQKFYGSGIGVTTVQVVQADFPEIHYSAFNHPFTYATPMSALEIADLTVDCNLLGQPHNEVAVGAALASGPNIAIRRVRAINFGSQTKAYVENFVFAIGAVHPNAQLSDAYNTNLLFEDCIVEHFPANSGIANSFAFNFGGGERPNDGATSYHRGCAIRNCYVNGDIVYNPLVPIASFSVTGSSPEWTVEITTKAPHQLTLPANAMVRNVAVNGSFSNPFNGLFKVESVDAPNKKFTYKITTDPTGLAPTGGTVGGGVSTQLVSIESITEVTGPDVPANTYKVTTFDPHLRTTNNNVFIRGVEYENPPDSDVWNVSTRFNGVFAVAKRVSDTEFEYQLLGPPETANWRTNSAFIGTGHIALGADGGTAAIVEGNRVLNISVGGPYHDTYSSPDLTVRDNYYYNVSFGPSQNLGGLGSSDVPNALVSIDYDDSVELSNVLATDFVDYYENRRAVATRSFPHGFILATPKDRVNITGAAGPEASFYLGDKEVIGVPSPTVFEYDLTTRVTTKTTGAGYFTIDRTYPKFFRAHRALGPSPRWRTLLVQEDGWRRQEARSPIRLISCITACASGRSSGLTSPEISIESHIPSQCGTTAPWK